MNRFRNILPTLFVSASLLLVSNADLQAQSRHNDHSRDNSSRRVENSGGSYRRNKGEATNRNSGTSNRSEANRRPNQGSQNNAGRPGGNQNINRPGGNAGNPPNQGNHNNRPHQGNNGNHNGNHNPGNNGNHNGNANVRPNPAPQYRPGAAGQNRPSGNPQPPRPQQPPQSNLRPGQNPGPQPGYNPGHNPGHPGGPNTVRPGMNMHRPPVAPPPPRPYHPANWHYTGRPVPPPSWRPPSRPFFSTVLGLAFGSAINISLDYLFNSGYNVDGYSNNTVYLNDVRQLGFIWPYASLFYDTAGYLAASEFVYSSTARDPGRYNAAYSALVRAYGPPVSVSNLRGEMTASWWGADNQYITLRFNLSAPQNGRPRYFTTLTFGI